MISYIFASQPTFVGFFEITKDAIFLCNFDQVLEQGNPFLVLQKLWFTGKKVLNDIKISYT